MTASRVVTGIVVLGGLFFLMPGIFAVADPASFYDELAPWEPYNEHFIHDIGAFQIGIGAALLLAAVWPDAKFVALGGAATGAAVHFLMHVIDQGDGGMDSDPFVFGVVAVVLAVGAALQWRVGRRVGG